MYQTKKRSKEKHVDLLLIGKEKKHTVFLSMISIDSCVIIHYIVEKNIFVAFVYMLSLQKKYLKCHIKHCFKINGKQIVKMPKKGEYVKFKNFERKVKSPFMIYADFESILLSEDNVKQNQSESYTNKCQKHVACSCVFKLVCVDDKFDKPFKSYLGKDAVYNFISSMIE